MFGPTPPSGASQDSMRCRAPMPAAMPKAGSKARPSKASQGRPAAKAATKPAPSSSKAKGSPKQSKAAAATPGCGSAAAEPAKGQLRHPEGGATGGPSTEAICPAAGAIKPIPSFTWRKPFA